LSAATRVQILLLALLRLVFNTGYRMVYPFLPVFARSLGVDLAAISLVLSARSLFGALGGFLAVLADSRGRRTGMLLGALLFVGGCLLVVLWPAFLPFAMALILITLGKVVFDPSVHAHVGDQVDYQQRATAVAIIEYSWSLSFILGVPFMGFLITRYGWTSPFTLLGVLGLGTLLAIPRLVPADPQPGPDQRTQMVRIWEILREVFTNRAALTAVLVSVLIAAANESVNIVFGAWIETNFGVQLAALGAASIVIGLSELSGEGLVSLLTDRVGKLRAIGGGIALNCLAAILLPLLGGSLAGALVGLFLFYITFEFMLVSTIPLMTEILPGARATVMAAGIAAFSVGRAAGAALAVPLFSYGIWANSTAAVLFNLAGLLALLQLGRVLRASNSTA
jgi:predicted MFS family arabinose efflux permease